MKEPTESLQPLIEALIALKPGELGLPTLQALKLTCRCGWQRP